MRVPPRQLVERPGEQHDRRHAEEVIDFHLRVERLGELLRVRLVDQLDELDQPGGLTDDDAAILAGDGFNVVRLGVIFEGLMPTRGHLDPAYLDRVVNSIDVLARHGIYALLDIHQDLMGAPWGNGFPQWAIHHSPALEAVERVARMLTEEVIPALSGGHGGDDEPHADDEVYVVLEGNGVLEIEGKPVELRTGHALFVPAGAEHRFSAYEQLSVLVIFDRTPS